MAKYNILKSANQIGVNTQRVYAKFNVRDASFDGDVAVYNPASFVDIYDYHASGPDGSNFANSYSTGSGDFSMNMQYAVNYGYPAFINYAIADNGQYHLLIANAFDQINSKTTDIGYPVSFLSIKWSTSTNKIACETALISGKSSIQFNAQVDKIYIQLVRTNYGSPSWLSNDGFGNSEYAFEHYLGAQTSLFHEFDISNAFYNSASYTFELIAWTKIGDVTSAKTSVRFKFVKQGSWAAIQIDDNRTVNGYVKKNMYDGRYFSITNGRARLPMFVKV